MLMTISSAPTSQSSVNPLKALAHLSWPWRVTFIYLFFMLLVPLTALVLRASTVGPAEFWRIATDRVAMSTYEVTFVTALIAALINGVLGTLTAWVLVRYRFPFKTVIEGILDLPFALPTAVAGLTLATVYSTNGWIGSLLAPMGIRISFTRLGVGVAMLFISLPFVVRTVQPVLQEIEKEVEEAAWSLGASRFQTFWKVLLPQLMTAILTGVALGFSRAVGEYGSIVIIASSIPFRDLIAAVLVIQRLEQYDYAGATVIGTVLLLISLVSLIAINLLQAWGRRYEA
ncbi:sulfate ABC transporter permease subunit CysT [Synechococcus bigranulatus str. 'Rupite']|uniref:Sulfate transport system permease protein CysT n=2 Tax=Thermostichus vulcanus TaxID=32053 RepID=A0ABT0CB31_THEVL|nr:sulfate ABC transporter permease subunit CysT [Thermostichus vulcanus str. 'Rupite']